MRFFSAISPSLQEVLISEKNITATQRFKKYESIKINCMWKYQLPTQHNSLFCFSICFTNILPYIFMELAEQIKTWKWKYLDYLLLNNQNKPGCRSVLASTLNNIID